MSRPETRPNDMQKVVKLVFDRNSKTCQMFRLPENEHGQLTLVDWDGDDKLLVSSSMMYSIEAVISIMKKVTGRGFQIKKNPSSNLVIYVRDDYYLFETSNYVKALDIAH
ncbi:MAG: hypothetical protein GF349_02715 [Candidatus Magasanikbacteria bacterium]|nr:hypothetical protein [Candidatus Magasanikbacteria bacterium]